MAVEETSADFLMQRFRKDEEKSDNAKSRCWMLTAKLMLPDSFEVQFEAYLFEKNNGQPGQAAKLLASMLEAFIFRKGSDCNPEGKYKLLWDEINAISELLQVIQEGKALEQKSLLEKVFDELSCETSTKMLLRTAESRTDILNKTRLLLSAFRKFPNLLASTNNGIDCLQEVLDVLEKTAASNEEQSRLVHRDLLNLSTTDLLPLLLGVPNFHMEEVTLQKIIMFMARHVFSGIESIDFSWDTVLGNLEAIGNRFRADQVWYEATRDLKNASKDPHMLFKRLMELFQKNGGDSPRHGIFYVTAFIFLKLLSQYWKLLTSKPGFVLVEGFADHQDTTQAGKRRRTTDEERRLPLVTHGRESESELVTIFPMTSMYYEFLITQQFFGRWQQFMRHSIDMAFERSLLMVSFGADFAILNGQFREGLAALRQTPEAEEENPPMACALHVKLASFYFCLGEHTSVLDQIVTAVTLAEKCFKDEKNENEQHLSESRCLKEIKRATVRLRHLHFLEMSKQSVISFGCKLLVHVLKDKSLQPTLTENTDISIGHVIVMLQYSQPEERDLLGVLLHKIRLRDTFVYPIFCRYVVHIDFLEEFAAIASADNCNLILDPVASAMAGQRRVGTRGANRGEKSEVRNLIRKQVARSYENLDVLISDFLVKNRDSIFQCLL